MKSLWVSFVVIFSLTWSVALNHADGQDVEINWHQLRGPMANGVAPNGDPPAEFGEKKNLKWKVPVKGRGSSTPIVWEDQIFLLTAVKTEKIDDKKAAREDQPKRSFGITFPNEYFEHQIVCLNRETGKEIWTKVAKERVPFEGVHPDNDYASATPTTDGERLYVPFGSAGYYCYDLDGNELWKRDLGELQTRKSFGEGSSPTIHEDKLIVVRDGESQSFIEVLDAKTGKTIWRKDRDEPSAWSTPLVVETESGKQIVTTATNRSRSYDLESGKLVWECSGQVTNVTASPMLHDNLVYCMSGYQGSILQAIDINSKGDVSQKVTWTVKRDTPYIASGILYGERLYFTQSLSGVVTCVNAKDGKTIFKRTRLPGINRLYASPAGAKDRIYYCGQRGGVAVIENGDSFKVVHETKLKEGVNASPVIVGKQLFIRGSKSLYCFEEGS